MRNSVSGRIFAVAVRMKHRQRETPTLSRAETNLQGSSPSASEIAAAAGLDAVRRALEEMLGGEHATT